MGRAAGDALAVCGDLNVLPGSETLALLSERLGAAELVTSRGLRSTRTAFYEKPERFADYMFVGGAAVRSFDVVAEPAVSDHAMLLVEIG